MNRKDIEISAKEHVELGKDVDVLLSSKGWQIYTGFLRAKIEKIRAKDKYRTLQDFRSDRKVIKILLEIDAELRDAVTDAHQAQEIISKLNQTSDLSDIPIDDGEETDI